MVDIAVITAHNEQDTIGELVTALRGLGLYVVVVNDGSDDDTSLVADMAGANVIDHPSRHGIGKSLVDAWNRALMLSADRVVQLDAGGSHDPQDARRMLDALKDADMVIGSRFMRSFEEGRGLYIGRPGRALASRFAAKMLNFAAHTHFTDWTSGYRAFNRKALLKLTRVNYWEDMHPWQIEVLGAALHGKLKVKEIPITYVAGRPILRLNTLDGAFMEWLRLFFY